MNVTEAIRARRSIRVYSRKPIEEATLNGVLEAARLAPSARNMQEWKMVVVRDKTAREKLMRAAGNQSFLAQAPAVIAACGTITDVTMRCGQLSYPVDVAIALEHVALAAAEAGLGTCWVCAFNEAEVKEIIAAPEGARVVALMAIGYPGETPEARPRKPAAELFAFERFG